MILDGRPPDRLVLLGNLEAVRAVGAGGDTATSEEACCSYLPHLRRALSDTNAGLSSLSCYLSRLAAALLRHEYFSNAHAFDRIDDDGCSTIRSALASQLGLRASTRNAKAETLHLV